MNLGIASAGPELERPARVVEIRKAGHSVGLAGDELVVIGDEGEIARAPVREIAVLVAWPGLSWSASALTALGQAGVGVVLLGSNYRSRLFTWPLPGHRWSPRMRAQLALDPPRGRQLLRVLESVRDAQRHAVLAAMGKRTALKSLGEDRTGDGRRNRKKANPDVRNSGTEGRLARFYWPWLVGPGFRRNPGKAGPNGVINFGHTVLRIEAARAARLAGLNPGFGLAGSLDGRGLAGELMLPWRPVVDLAAAIFVATGHDKVDQRVRDAFARLFDTPLPGRQGPVQIRFGMEMLAEALAEGVEGTAAPLSLRLPALGDPSLLYDLIATPVAVPEAG